MLLYDHLVTLPEEVSPSFLGPVLASVIPRCAITGSDSVEEEENVP
jgi:hypothetical protein